MSWHLSESVLDRYVADRCTEAEALSAETHLVGCATCRAALAPRVHDPALARAKARLADAVDQPRVGWVERGLRLLGVRPPIARILALTPALRGAWFLALATVAVTAYAARTITGANDELAFLVLAPLLPLAAIAISFSAPVDVAREIGRAAPFPASRLFLLRAAAVLTVNLGVLSIGALLLPVGHAWLWVLPALALVAATLAGSTWVSPLAAASVAAAAWCAVLTTSRVYASGRGEFAVRLAAFRPAGQLLAATVALIATAVFLARTPRFDEPIRRIQP